MSHLRTLFVPLSRRVTEDDVRILSQFIEDSPSHLVVTGAGISTESGLPDYRSEGIGLYAKKDHKVTNHVTFVKSVEARKSYWLRNFVGWSRWSSVRPNVAHRRLAEWEWKGKVRHIITQNVDQLHFKAGSANVLELHGTNSVVICLECKFSIHRLSFQEVLKRLNPELGQRPPEQAIRPDGDVNVSLDDVDKFRMPECPKCGGTSLKPQIVFFGDNVPKAKVDECKRLVSEVDAVLAIGTSLQTFSSYRLLLQASEEGKRIGILNIGDTRADHLADVKINVRAGDILERVKLQ